MTESPAAPTPVSAVPSPVSTGANLSPADTCLMGSLESWPLPDILLWLHKTGRSAMLRVGAGLNAGIIFFKAGHLYRVEWGRLQGTEALWHLLHVREGVFSLIQRDMPEPHPNVTQPTEHLLLQWAVSVDEQQRAAQG